MDKKLLEEILEQAKISHDWMLATIQHNADDTQGGNYNDELKHAILVQELLDTTESGKE